MECSKYIDCFCTFEITIFKQLIAARITIIFTKTLLRKQNHVRARYINEKVHSYAKFIRSYQCWNWLE